MLYSARAQGAPAARPPLCSRRAGGETHGPLSVVGVQVEVEEDVAVVVVGSALTCIANGMQRAARGLDAGKRHEKWACVACGMHVCRRVSKIAHA